MDYNSCGMTKKTVNVKEASERTANGKMTVRWNGEARQKEIRTYAEGRNDPGRGEPAVTLIPKRLWRKP
jgi:hypothetical protein